MRTGALPTIASMRAQGVVALTVHCHAYPCGHSGRITFDKTGMPDSAVFIHISKLRRFICSRCGNRQYEVFPDWSTFIAKGNGRRPLT